MTSDREPTFHPTDKLRASHAGYRVHEWIRSGRLSTYVHSIFERTCNLETRKGRLITLLAPARPGPANIVVPGLEAVLHRAEEGQRATITAGAVAVPKANLVIDLTKAQIWEPVSPPDRPLPPASSRRAAVRTAMGIALERTESAGLAYLLPELIKMTTPVPLAPESKLEAGILRAAREAILELEVVLERMTTESKTRRTGDKGDAWGVPPERIGDGGGTPVLEAAVASATRLIGLGPGLTPAGDDFLTGLILALRYADAAPGTAVRGIDSFGRRVAEMAVGRTTRVSEEQLYYAARAEAEGVMARAAIALLWRAEPLRPAVETLLETGSTSGGDLLTGICTTSVWL